MKQGKCLRNEMRMKLEVQVSNKHLQLICEEPPGAWRTLGVLGICSKGCDAVLKMFNLTEQMFFPGERYFASHVSFVELFLARSNAGTINHRPGFGRTL